MESIQEIGKMSLKNMGKFFHRLSPISNISHSKNRNKSLGEIFPVVGKFFPAT